jgi:hypothetical protein
MDKIRQMFGEEAVKEIKRQMIQHTADDTEGYLENSDKEEEPDSSISRKESE